MTTQHGTEWDKAHQAWQDMQHPQPAQQPKPTNNNGATLVALGITSLVLAVLAAFYASNQAKRDNPFTGWDETSAADYTLTLGLAGLGAFLILLGVILRAGDK